MVNRQTLAANTNTTFAFDMKVDTAIVKNFTSGYIFVAPDTYVEANAYKIPSMTAQKLTVRTDTIIVNAASGGEVEIDA